MDSQGDSTYLETARLRVDEFRAIWKFSDLACCQCKPRFHAFATATSCVAHDSDCHLRGISGPDPTVHVRYQRRGRRRWESLAQARLFENFIRKLQGGGERQNFEESCEAELGGQCPLQDVYRYNIL